MPYYRPQRSSKAFTLPYYRPQRSWDKVIFSQASVILSMGWGGWYPSMPCKRSPGGSAPRGGGLLPGGCLVWGGGCSWGGFSRPTPKGEVERGTGPDPYPRGKLRGIRSRPTPKGEIEGDQVQAHTIGGN